MKVLQVEGLSKQMGDGYVVKQISFAVAKGEKIGIAGQTGSGKSSLLKMIAGLMQPDEGRVLFHQKRVEGPDEKLIAGHPQIGYLSQHFELRNNYHVHELLEMSNQLSDEAAANIYKICDIESFLHRWTDELSGGEKQRIALAKILVAQPSLLLLDEPFSNMDVIHKKQLQKVIQQIGASLSLTCIMVSHDASELLSWADQLYLMQNGNFLQSGDPRLLYQQPLNAYCAALLGDVNLLDASSSLFPALRSFFPDTTQWMIRPENIQIGGIDGIIADGKVSAIHFMGPFSLLDVKVGEQLLKVYSAQQSFNVGDTIRLSINAAAIHPMDKG